MVHQELADVHGLFHVARITGLAVHHREAVQAPGLAAGPCGIVAVALLGLLPDDLARLSVIVDDVPGAVVRAVVVADRGVGMRARHIHEFRVSGQGGGHRQQLQVHHVVHDHDEIAVLLRLRIPGARAADRGVETHREGIAGVDDHLPVVVAAGQAPAVAVAAVDHETDVVVGLVVLLGSHAFRHPLRGGAQRFVAAVFVEIPERSREEACHPVPRGAGHQPPVPGGIDERRILILDRFVHPHRLRDGEVHLFLDELRHFLLWSGSVEREDAAEAAQRRESCPFHQNLLAGCCWERSSILLFS